MGNCSSPEKRKDKRIQKELRAEAKKQKNKLKILLLGAGESGKTTLYKQINLLYGKHNEYLPEEKANYQRPIYSNIYSDFTKLLRSFDLESKQFITQEAEEAAEKFIEINKKNPIGVEESKLLKILWNDKNLQDHWDNRGTIQIQDSLSYYLDNIERIGQKGWEPTGEDILRVRVRTSGVQSSTLKLNKVSFDVYDVGGQRVERPKWIDHFDLVTSVLFVTASSEYNQVLFEDPTVNRQDESVELFRKMINHRAFTETPFILFLNKNDLFREKLGRIPFRIENGPNKRNVDFPGPHLDASKVYSYQIENTDPVFEKGYQSALEYLKNLYENQVEEGSRGEDYTLYWHATTSIDAENVNKIFITCSSIVLKGFLNDGW